jgi:hypothetical protein
MPSARFHNQGSDIETGDRRMTKHSRWLIAGAASALIAGSGLAFGQGMQQPSGGMQGGASGGMQGGASGERNLGSGGGAATTGQEGGSMRDSQPSTSGQGSSSDRMQSDRPQAQDRGAATRDETQPQRGDTTRSGAQSSQQRGTSGQSSERGTNGQGSAGANTSVNLSSQQRTQIRQVVLRNHSIPHVNNVDVRINVGAVLPRTVELIDVPEDVVTIFPRFRRHKIVIIHDQVVIVEPSTFKIVAVLPA